MTLGDCRDIVRSVQLWSSRSDAKATYEVAVRKRKVMARLTNAVYELEKRRKRGKDDNKGAQVIQMWESVGYSRKELDDPELGIGNDLSSDGPEVWYAIFMKNEQTQSFRGDPKVVIAVRGTRASWQDFMSDVGVVFQIPDRDHRYLHLKKVTSQLAEKFGNSQVAISGRSLGATFAMYVGKALEKDNIVVETHLFNAPLITLDMFSCKGLRDMQKVYMIFLLAAHWMLAERRSPISTIQGNGSSTGKWTPYLYLNEGDVLSRGYIHRHLDNLPSDHNWLRNKVNRFVENHTLISIVLQLWGQTRPTPLVPTAIMTVASSRGDPISCHRLDQWNENAYEWQSSRAVEKLAFGRQVIQRFYLMKREDITPTDEVGQQHVKVTIYSQIIASTALQVVATTATLGLATSKQMQVCFLFNTAQDAVIAHRLWPTQLFYYEVSGCIAESPFEYLFKKVQKGACTFYLYAVRSKGAPFRVEAAWLKLVEVFNEMDNVIDWIKIVRRVLLVGALAM